MITSALPAVIVILSIIILKERLTNRTTLCVCVAVAGLLIINLRNLNEINQNQLYGDALIIALSFARSNLLFNFKNSQKTNCQCSWCQHS